VELPREAPRGDELIYNRSFQNIDQRNFFVLMGGIKFLIRTPNELISAPLLLEAHGVFVQKENKLFFFFFTAHLFTF